MLVFCLGSWYKALTPLQFHHERSLCQSVIISPLYAAEVTLSPNDILRMGRELEVELDTGDLISHTKAGKPSKVSKQWDLGERENDVW